MPCTPPPGGVELEQRKTRGSGVEYGSSRTIGRVKSCVGCHLVVVQGFVIGAWCSLCLLTAAISLVLVFLAYDEVWASILFLRRTWRATHNWRVLWTVFRGGAHPAAAAVALERS